ncbi:hypothetical protein [Psychrobacter sp. DAB_AL43B]|uniref:hypothetical protein n=1 Tax=Psychrobacter sp. DAB_AL43B TaxID=1028416 RepID=UPI0009A5B7C7|nr:hypothetical protein [Psychrobacter sp. DAB_AL43B]SLJ85469.1 Ig domain-containing protein [Psychrobacter sp. DAB_AL43B]
MSYSALPLTSKLFQLTFLTCALALAGCGGGDGTDIVAPAPDLGVQPGTGTDGGGIGNGNIGNVLKISPMSLLDANGNLTRVVSTAGATAKVTVTDSKGNGVSGALVTFNGEGVKFGTTNGAVLTNAEGVATTSVVPLSSNDTSSYSLSATAKYEDMTATTAEYNYSLQSVDITLVSFSTGESVLESGASTIVTLQTKDTVTNQFQNDVTVNFSATCGSFENAIVSSSNQGNISSTYKAIGSNGNLCEGKQTITAVTANNTSSAQSIEINIKAIKASNIIYSTNESVVLGAKDSGSSSSGQIEFTVYSNGVPAANQEVILDLIKSPIDFNFISQGNRNPDTLKSDSSGRVTVNLYPGNIPGPVEIQATLKSDKSISASAKNIAVATGRPTQKGITLALEKNVLADNAIDTSGVSVYLTDRQGNFVPNGTVVSFVAEGGTITPNCATVEGNCSVTFTSQNPRPANGRVSVIAYVEGDKAYSDLNGDNVYTAGIDSLLDNIGNFFRDDNEDLKYNPGEFVYKRGALPDNAKQVSCAASTLSQPNLPNFVLENINIPTTCDDSLATVLRKQIIMGVANDTPTFYNYRVTPEAISFEMYGNSLRTVSMPSGTTLSLAVNDKTPNNNLSCESDIVDGNITVPKLVNLNRVDGTTNQNFFEGSEDILYTVSTSGCASGDSIKLSVTTPAPTSKTTTVQLF